jgi:hypothetical protein
VAVSETITIDPAPEGFPPLMLVFPGQLLRREYIDRLRESTADAFARRVPLAIEGNCEVYQMVGGRWERLR